MDEGVSVFNSSNTSVVIRSFFLVRSWEVFFVFLTLKTLSLQGRHIICGLLRMAMSSLGDFTFFLSFLSSLESIPYKDVCSFKNCLSEAFLGVATGFCSAEHLIIWTSLS